MTTEVIVVGKGIGGLVLSLLLKRNGIPHLLLSCKRARKPLALGETLPPSALPLLQSLDLLELFEHNTLHRTYGYHSAWGSTAILDHNFFSHSPFQYGLKLDKRSLEHELEELISENVFEFEKITSVNAEERRATVRLQCDRGHMELQGRCLVDATGRSRTILRELGIVSTQHEQLIAYSCHLPRVKRQEAKHGVFVESFEHGWGIVSSLSEQMQVMSLFTRHSIGVDKELKDYSRWPAILDGTRHLKEFLPKGNGATVVGSDASSSRATQFFGKNWLAVGDAALAFDPLSSHGITNALYTARQAIEVIKRRLSDGDERHFREYGESLSGIFRQYLQSRNDLYRREQRWPESLFWAQC